MLKIFRMRSRLFRQYLLVIISIIFISVGVTVMLSSVHMMNNIRTGELHLLKSKMFTIAEDFDNQMESIREMAVEMAFLQLFQRNYIEQNKYHEIEVVERLASYGHRVEIEESLFVKYGSRDVIFTSAGTTMPLEVYCKRIGVKAVDEMIKELDALSENAGNRVIIWRDGDILFFFCPLKEYATNGSSNDGILCIQSSVTRLQERVEHLVGKINGDIGIWFQDICLTAKNDEMHDEVIEQKSSTGEFRISIGVYEDAFFSWKNVLSGRNIVIFLVITLLLSVLAYGIAHYFYRPIRNIAEKYSTAENPNLMWDWHSIDDMIDELLRGKVQDEKNLQKQYRILRERTIQLVVSGGCLDKLQKHLTLLNVKLDALYFGIIACEFSVEQTMEESIRYIDKSIEDLSENETCLYPYWESGKILKILTVADEEYQLEEALELVQALFDSMNLESTIALCAKSNTLEELGHRRKDTENIVEEPELPQMAHVTGTKRKRMAYQVIEYIKSHCTDYDFCLDKVAQEYNVSSSYLGKLVKQEVGTSYKEYLTMLRISRAKQILAEEGIGVAEVCQRVGYTNVSHFIKLFTNQTGMTPAKFRDVYFKLTK